MQPLFQGWNDLESLLVASQVTARYFCHEEDEK